MDIREIVQKAVAFRTRLKAIKADISNPGFEWYPHDSLSNFQHLSGLLTGERRLLLDLIGDKPVLDIGCGDGDVAFFLESLGCKVIVVDNERSNHNGMQGLRTLKKALNSSIEISEQDVDYHLRLPEVQFGVAFLLGVLYHLKNPFRVLETLFSRSQYCVVATRVTRFAPTGADLNGIPVAYLVDETETNNDNSNYWMFTNAGLKRLLERSGWRIADYMSVGNTSASDPVTSGGDERAYCLAERTGGPITTGLLGIGWHEQEAFGDWRWTERTFSVVFHDVSAAARRVSLQFFLPAAMEERFGSVELSVTVNGQDLPGSRYTGSARYVYEETIPEAALLDRPVVVTFTLSEALPPSESDLRELGIVVSSIRLL